MSEAEKSQSVKGVKESFSEKDVEDVNTTLTTLPLVANVTERQSEDDSVETVIFCRDLDEFQRAFEEDCVDIEAELVSSSLVYRDVLLEKLVERAWASVQVLSIIIVVCLSYRCLIIIPQNFTGGGVVQISWLDPLDLSQYVASKGAGGVVAVSRAEQLYSADIRLWNVSLAGLADITLHQVSSIVSLLGALYLCIGDR